MKKTGHLFTNDFSEEIYTQTYKYHTDRDIIDTFIRVAKDLSSAEKDGSSQLDAKTLRTYLESDLKNIPSAHEKLCVVKFLKALWDFNALPGGRITSNAGTGLKGTTYINCFHKSAKVLTGDGYVPICDVKVGQKVLTHKGRWRSVVNTLSRQFKGKARLIKTPLASDDILVTPEHPFYNKDGSWTNAEKLSHVVLSRIANDEGLVSLDLFEILRQNSNFNNSHRKLEVDGDKLTSSFICRGGNGCEIDRRSAPVNRFIVVSPEVAYFLGRYCGDGSVFNVNKISSVDGFNLVFSHKEVPELELVKSTIEKEFGLDLNINESKNQDCVYLRKNNVLIASFLEQEIGRYGYNKRVPRFIWNASSSVRESFLLGLFDADGCVTPDGSVKIALQNPRLIDEVQSLLSTIGCASYKRIDKTYDIPMLTIAKSTISDFRKRMRKHYSDDRISRKYKDYTCGENWKTVCLENVDGLKSLIVSKISVDDVDYDDTVYNISVDEDESYVVNNVIVHNCFVDGFLGENRDSMEGIMDALKRQALILKSEGGYGFCADVMRPRGAFIEGVGSESPGAVRMLDMWDKQSEVITSGSGLEKKEKRGKGKIRKGAQMVTMSVWHPDIEEFITAKQTPGRLSKFNMSVMVTDDFMDAVENHKPWDLVFPRTNFHLYSKEWDGNIHDWVQKGYPVVTYKTYADANELWELITKSTYNRNEPGVLFIDTINKLNPLYYSEYIDSTNPCGEQVLSKGSVCLLGSLNLTQFVDSEKRDWDYKKLSEIIPSMVRLMDNVNDKTYVPLPLQKENLKTKRRIGLGYLGYASALYMLKLRYGSQEALDLTDKLGRFVTNEAYKASALLAKEKGSFLLFDKDKYLSGEFVKRLDPDTLELIKKYGLRNSHLLSIQPTGNSSIFANNVSGGLEPVFRPQYVRTAIQNNPPKGMGLPIINWEEKSYVFADGVPSDERITWTWAKEGDESVLVSKFNGEVYKIDKARGLLKETTIKDYGVAFLEEQGEWDPNAHWAVDAGKLSIDDHVRTMAVFSKYVDSAISKTVNVPNDYPYEDFKRLYMDVYKTGTIKGCTTYREGTMTAVLASESTAAKTEPSLGQDPDSIPFTRAPKRPKELPCEIHQLTAVGSRWVVLVGLLNEKPYEVFAFKAERFAIPASVTAGTLIKSKSGQYDLECADGWVLKDVSHFESDEQEALTRMISTALRHGAPIKFVVAQLAKAEGTITSFAKAVARTIKKYVEEDELLSVLKCSECGSKDIQMAEGCFKCISCGSSKCG